MAEEPSLPPLPPSLAALPPSLHASDRRKRGRSPQPPPTHSSTSTSSDPAYFSSDDDPALDNYESHGRRKKRYVGSWFDQQPASSDPSDSGVGDDSRPTRYRPPRRSSAAPRPQKREFRRQLDSGVWMGTDGAMTDTDDGFDLEPVPARLPLASPEPERSPAPAMPLSPARPVTFSPAEEQARLIIRTCVDHGNEQVDLSGLGLDITHKGVLEPIAHIAPIPTVAKDVAFEQREPHIRLFLSNNRLRRFPVELLDLEHLTVLSLRGNHLITIPPAIARLTNLVSLNIAQNFLRFLPGELLTFLQSGSKLRTFNFEPNWFCRPNTTRLGVAPGAEKYESLTFGIQPRIEAGLEPGFPRLATRLQCRTPVHFMDCNLNAHSRFVLPQSAKELRPGSALEVEPFNELAVPKALGPELRACSDTSKVVKPRGPKSLLELAVRACATSDEADEIPAWLCEEGMPAHLAPAVHRAIDIHREGGAACSVCGRKTLMPLAQWIEFRHVGQVSSITGSAADGLALRFMVLGDPNPGGRGAKPLPFLRVGCSWRCVPAKVEDF